MGKGEGERAGGEAELEGVEDRRDGGGGRETLFVSPIRELPGRKGRRAVACFGDLGGFGHTAPTHTACHAPPRLAPHHPDVATNTRTPEQFLNSAVRRHTPYAHSPPVRGHAVMSKFGTLVMVRDAPVLPLLLGTDSTRAPPARASRPSAPPSSSTCKTTSVRASM